MDDITYMTVNKNMKSSGATLNDHEKAMDPELKKLQKDFAENFATVDMALYRHFNKTFWKKVELYKITEKDVQDFKKHQNTVFNRCFSGTEPLNRRRLEKEFHPWIPPGSRAKIMTYIFTEKGVENDFCRNLVRPELAYAQRLRAKQHLPIEPKFVFDSFLNLYTRGLVDGNDVADVLRLPRSVNITFASWYDKIQRQNP